MPKYKFRVITPLRITELYILNYKSQKWEWVYYKTEHKFHKPYSKIFLCNDLCELFNIFITLSGNVQFYLTHVLTFL